MFSASILCPLKGHPHQMESTMSLLDKSTDKFKHFVIKEQRLITILQLMPDPADSTGRLYTKERMSWIVGDFAGLTK